MGALFLCLACQGDGSCPVHPSVTPLVIYVACIILYYGYAVSLTTLSVQLRIYAPNCMAKCIHTNTAFIIEN